MTPEASPAPPAKVGFRALWAPALAIVALAFAVRAMPLTHGLPGLYVPDTHGVRNALGMLQTRNLVPRSNEFSSYPYLYSYLCLPLFVGDYGVARASGRVKSTEEYQQYAVANLDHFHYLARWIPAFAGALAAGAAVFAGAWLAGRAAGLWSGILAASSPLCYLLSTHERPWALLFLMTTLSLLFALKYARTGSRQALVVSGIFAGLSAGCHQAGATAFLQPLGALVAVSVPWNGAGLVKLVRGGAVALAGFIPAFLLGNPYLVRYGPRGAVATDLTQQLDMSVGGQGLAFKFDAKYTVEALTGLVGLEGVALLLAIVGVVLLTKRRDRALWVPLSLALPVFLLFSIYTGTHARYFLLAYPAIWVLGGGALAVLGARGRAGLTAACVLVALPSILTLRTCQLLLRTDTRAAAAIAIGAVVDDGEVVAVEPYGPALPPRWESLARLAELEQRQPDVKILTRRERLALDRREPGGLDTLPLERVVADPAPNGYRHLGALAPRLYPGADTLDKILRAANVKYVVCVDRFPGAVREDPLVKILEVRGTWVADFSPVAGGASPLEALLPFEPRLGVYSLFSVERPGPLVRLYELKP